MFVPHVNKLRRSPSKSSLPRVRKTSLSPVFESSLPTAATTSRKTSRPLPPLPVKSGLTKSNSVPGISSGLENLAIDDDMGPRDGIVGTPTGWRKLNATLQSTKGDGSVNAADPNATPRPLRLRRQSFPEKFDSPSKIGQALSSPGISRIPSPSGDFAVSWKPRVYLSPADRQNAAPRNFSLPNNANKSSLTFSDSGSESDSALPVIEPEGVVLEPENPKIWFGWQLNAAWSGRFSGCSNRLKTNGFHITVNDETMMAASLDNTRLYNDDGSIKMGSRTTPETAGLNYMKSQDIAIAREAFRIMESECGDDLAVESLMEFQRVYAKIEKIPELLPEEVAAAAAKAKADAEEKLRSEEEARLRAEEEARRRADELIAEEEAGRIAEAARAKAAAAGASKKGKGKKFSFGGKK
ncbi:hypothetical protein BDZ45DRAFT_12447 [Acephala macrosclerotiorum]|nr:hypothetical protein BDZ45DRAFT_12447 [Acephala macrosclerotiorum]